MRNFSSIKLGVPRLCLYCSCSWPYIFLPRCQTDLHASRPMWLKPSPTFTSRKHVMRNTKGERPERCMQAFPRHPSRRSRRHLRRLAVDESATKAETSKLKLPGQRLPSDGSPHLSLVRAPASLSLESPQLESAGKECLKSAVGTSVPARIPNVWHSRYGRTSSRRGRTSLATADCILK
jgi:hypothetical protein